MSQQANSRRRFIAAGSAAAVATIVPRHVLGGPGFVAPSDKVNVAMIGVGGQGRTNTRALLHEKDCQVIAIADPAEDWDLSAFYFRGRAGRGPVKAEIESFYASSTPNYRCGVYEDFRVMLEKEKAIDAVVVSTPDHLHAYASILAMRAGKHVYCEKPLSHNVWESRAVARVAAETGVATQLGIQGRAGEGHRQTAEWIWDGAIGAVKEVHSWSGGGGSIRRQEIPEGTHDVPPGLNWDLWLGPREPRPFHPAYVPCKWRRFWPFGGGTLPDQGLHDMDPAFFALDLGAPETVEASSTGVDPEICSYGVFVTWRFGARGNRGPLSVHWYDGGLRPPTPADIDTDDPKQRLGEGVDGILFVGERGYITCAGWSGMPRLLPLERHREYVRPARTLPRVDGIHADWLQACKGGRPACANFSYGARLNEFVLLGNVALRTRKRLTWDAAGMKATNAAEADQYLREDYRKGWELPEPLV
ncbi:MAG: Gfo/Idh/MocA family oxidoreductase [Acidobacteria bacterium]|jgi:predicted dehydrogenase|nr:Gfo/Idh/MocA family oxidoreductase [Acidobacteriota bacterium]